MNKQEAIEAIEKIKYIDTLTINDRITGQQVDMVIKSQVLDIISQIDEPEKPVVPQVVIDYYEQYKDNLLSLSEWFDGLYERTFLDEFPEGDKLLRWLHDNDYKTNLQHELALATLIVNGVEAVQVEKQKLYTVEIPDPNVDEYSIVLGRKEGKVQIKQTLSKTWQMNCSNQLTETEIKEDFEWAWKWAKPVEE
ncbi:DUF1642 domain-containing protein [Streptococcus pluranimalium]